MRCVTRFVFGASLLTASLLLASCSGGSGVSLPSQSSTAPGANAPSANQSERLYVASGNVPVFDASANGNVAPLFTIDGIPGCAFGISTGGVVGVAVDGAGRIFTATVGQAINPQIAIFTVSPALVPTFVGEITGDIHAPWQIAVDNNDHVYLANQETESISIYAPGPTGVNGAFAVIQGPHTGLNSLHGVAVDSAGDIFASNESSSTGSGNIVEFAPGSNGDVAPIAQISGPNTQLNAPFGIAIDSADKLYASGTFGGGVAVFAKGATGDVAPIQLIRGSNTTLQDALSVAVGSTGKIYVLDFGPIGGNDADIAVFAPGANGNVAPIAVIHGPATGFHGATNIAVR